MTHHADAERALFEAVASDDGKWPKAIERDAKGNYLLLTTANGWMWWQAARRAPAVPETIEQRAKKLKGLQVLIGATAGVPEAIELARSRFTEAYGRSPLHDDLAYACLLIDAYGGAPAAPVPQGWKMVPVEPPREMIDAMPPVEETGYWAMYEAALAAAPQPPEAAKHCDTPNYCQSVQRCTAMDEKRAEAAPVQMPEPDHWTVPDYGLRFPTEEAAKRYQENVKDSRAPVANFTEQQVRQLLAAHGIGKDKA